MAREAPGDSGTATALRPSFGEALRERRQANRISVRALASQVGVSPSLVSQIENGKVNPSVDTLVALVTALGLSLDELFLDVPAKAGEPLPQPGGTGVVRADARRVRVALPPAISLEHSRGHRDARTPRPSA